MQTNSEEHATSEAPEPVPQTDAQREFEATYISSTEISEYVNVTRPAVFTARKRGYLPGYIIAGDGKVVFWKREQIMPALNAWRDLIQRRNGATPT